MYIFVAEDEPGLVANLIKISIFEIISDISAISNIRMRIQFLARWYLIHWVFWLPQMDRVLSLRGNRIQVLQFHQCFLLQKTVISNIRMHIQFWAGWYLMHWVF